MRRCGSSGQLRRGGRGHDGAASAAGLGRGEFPADVDEIIGDDAKSDPAPDARRPLVARAVQPACQGRGGCGPVHSLPQALAARHKAPDLSDCRRPSLAPRQSGESIRGHGGDTPAPVDSARLLSRA